MITRKCYISNVTSLRNPPVEEKKSKCSSNRTSVISDRREGSRKFGRYSWTRRTTTYERASVARPSRVKWGGCREGSDVKLAAIIDVRLGTVQDCVDEDRADVQLHYLCQVLSYGSVRRQWIILLPRKFDHCYYYYYILYGERWISV